MSRLRRFDWNAQIVIFIASIALIWTLWLALLGELLLGVWQLVSALVNTRPMLRSPFKKQIIIYWVLVAVSLLMLISPEIAYEVYGLSEVADNFGIFQGISLFGSLCIAIYYWATYKSFIDYLEHRKELDTLIRH